MNILIIKNPFKGTKCTLLFGLSIGRSDQSLVHLILPYISYKSTFHQFRIRQKMLKRLNKMSRGNKNLDEITRSTKTLKYYIDVWIILTLQNQCSAILITNIEQKKNRYSII